MRPCAPFAELSLPENETMTRLAAYAAPVAVPTIIVDIYAMNFDSMPELKWRSGYPRVLR